ncbi:hypothetical protein CASFOL_036710 [Castilleja foliolosa]|uniref:Glycosyltransferase n=1 Tax=Castilleja foliolosa TaxID=1961234 RepID=A0ABD3BNU6_9LAMI
MQIINDILVLPFFGQGHLFPCAELCKHLSSHNCRSILIIPSHLSSSIPSNLHQHPLVEVLQIPASNSPLPPPEKPERDLTGPGPKHHQQLGDGIESFLSERYKNDSGRARPVFVVMDVMMSWSKEIFQKENIPIVSFFTSGACATAMEHAAWKAHVDDMRPDETRILSGLPESLALSYSDLKRRERGHGGRGGGRPGGGGRGGGRPDSGGRGRGRPGGGMDFGPPKPGQPPRWMDESESSVALLINTCDDLEGPFLEYLTGQVGKPVLGVGPLLPDSYWKSSGSILHDRDSRPNRESNYTEDEVIQWLDSKQGRSVIYVSFGSEVGPTLEEYDQLAQALGESDRLFIWVIQPGSGVPGPPANFFGGKSEPSAKEEGYYPHGLEEKVKGRGLIIKGWAPQLLILSHPSTGGFLSHCGWNSTVEAIGRGVPILAWPIRGDQFYDAKLVVKYLGVGHMVSSGDDLSEMVKKCDVMRGIEAVMDDSDVRKRAMALRDVFEKGYPSSSEASLKGLIELVISE